MSWHQGPIICKSYCLHCVIGFQLHTCLIPAAGHNLPTEAPWRWRCCCPASQWHQPPCGPGEGLDMAIIGGALYALAGSFCLTNWWLFKTGCWICGLTNLNLGKILKKWWLFKTGCWICGLTNLNLGKILKKWWLFKTGCWICGLTNLNLGKILKNDDFSDGLKSIVRVSVPGTEFDEEICWTVGQSLMSHDTVPCGSKPSSTMVN